MFQISLFAATLLAVTSQTSAVLGEGRHASFQAEGSFRQLGLHQLLKTIDDDQIQQIIQSEEFGVERAGTLEFLRNLLFPRIPTAFSDKVGEQCKEDSVEYLRAFFQFTDWAMKMYDATGVDSPGMYSGTSHATGHFDQCLSVRNERFQGKHCTAFYNFYDIPIGKDRNSTDRSLTSQLEENPAYNMNLKHQKGLLSIFQLLGLVGFHLDTPSFYSIDDAYLFQYFPSASFCLPSSCNGTDLQYAFADLIGSYIILNDHGGLSVVVTYAGDEYCYVDSDDAPQFDAADITVICVLSVIAFALLASTLFEAVGSYVLGEPLLTSSWAKERKYVRYLCVFSLINNTQKLLSTRTNEGSLACVHGIRFLSITWVCLGHSWGLTNSGSNMNTGFLFTRINNWMMQTIFNATVSVDTFLVLSGLLAAYLLLNQLDKSKGRFNPLMLYLHRYLRLTPVYAVILGFNATLIVYLSAAPFWYLIEFYAKGCRQLWWQHFLYVNNFVENPASVQCMPETWYLAVDMQLFLVVPIFVYPLWRWRKWGLTALGLATLGCLSGSLAIYATTNVLPTLMTTRSDGDGDALGELYVKPWHRAPAYLVGIFVGWVLYATRNKNFKIHKALVCVGWACAIAVACAVLYGLTPYGVSGTVIPEAVRITYGTFHRFAWALSIGWLIFACIRGYGGYVNDFLSWKLFVPLGRLTYGIYLIHYNLLMVYVTHQKTLLYYTDLNSLYVHLATLFMSIGLAIIVSVSIETPCLLLEKMLLGKSSSRKETEHVGMAPHQLEMRESGNTNHAMEITE